MTQDAVVTKVLPNGMAEVVVSRGTACGSNCGNCESCVFQNEIKTFAKNTVHARPGEKVVIESLSSRIFGAAFIVYIVPMLVFIIGYVIAASCAKRNDCQEHERVVQLFGLLRCGSLCCCVSAPQ